MKYRQCDSADVQEHMHPWHAWQLLHVTQYNHTWSTNGTLSTKVTWDIRLSQHMKNTSSTMSAQNTHYTQSLFRRILFLLTSSYFRKGIPPLWEIIWLWRVRKRYLQWWVSQTKRNRWLDDTQIGGTLRGLCDRFGTHSSGNRYSRCRVPSRKRKKQIRPSIRWCTQDPSMVSSASSRVSASSIVGCSWWWLARGSRCQRWWARWVWTHSGGTCGSRQHLWVGVSQS